MEAKNEDIEVLPQPINLRDAEAAIINLAMQNRVFEDRFVSFGEALAEMTSGMKELQNSMKDLVFNRQNSTINEKKQDSPPDQIPDNLIRNNKSTIANPLQRTQQQSSRFQRFLSDRRNEQSRSVQVLSPVFSGDDDQKSLNSFEDVLPVDGFFPNNDDDEVNLSFQDNQAAVLSMRSRNVNLRRKEVKSKASKVVDRRDSMIRNLDRLTSGQDDNVRVYKSTPSYEHIKLNSDSISSILDFAAAIEQFQNMHKISVPAASLVSTDIREYLIGVADNARINSLTFYGLDNKSVLALLQK